MILDAGCGSLARHLPLLPHSEILYLDIEKTSGNKVFLHVLADIQRLPFRDDVFDLVWCDQVIEHTDNPYLTLEELIRVSKLRVVVKCPHRFFWKSVHPNPFLRHKHAFNVKWFVKTLRKMGFKHKKHFFIRTKMRGFPHPVLRIVDLPIEIRVDIWKR